MTQRFVHLHLHSEFSMADGICRIKPLVNIAAEQNMPAIALTDRSNLFGMVKFYRAAMAAGLKPIIGVDAFFQNEQDIAKPFRVLFLCQSNAGYKNLTRLVSRSYQENQHQGRAMMRFEWLPGAADDLIVLLGKNSELGQSLLKQNSAQSKQLLNDWLAIFGDRLYLQLQRTGREQEEEFIQAAVDLAIQNDIPVVASNDVHFLAKEDFEAHEARVCINEGRVLADPRRPKNFSDQQYLRSTEEMLELFADIPEAIENTVEIAKRCNLELTLGKNFLPNFPVPEGLSMEEYFGQLSREGLEKRLLRILDKEAPDYQERRKEYDERLQIELDVINGMGFPGYFLIVADFIQWAKENDIPVGPGRGSGAGSLVAYALTITDLDPIQYELLFERFLNPERVSMPDFDVDFCMDNRDRVIDYVARHYGREKVSQIITFGSMAAKAVVRDVGRVQGHPYGFTDKLAKLIPFELGITLKKALAEDELFKQQYDTDEEAHELIDMALSLEGITRNAGKHAGGVVIAPTALTDFTPLYCEEGGGNLVSAFDKDDVEAVGLVKFDFLGLRTLTIIDWAVKAVNKFKENSGEEPLDITSIPLDDEATFKLLKAYQTTAVFQLESRGMKDLIKRLQPDLFEDIIALVALFRPGPLQSGMVDDFINRKHGRAKIEYPHPDVGPILQPTYGVILYQEQVMQIAQVLAGYTLGGADMLRRAMGKKKPEEMAKQREIFTKGALERGIEEATATYIFDLMEKFAGYGFNKSHSAAYALVSYQTAWLKAHHPAPFMAAVLSSDMDNTEKVVGFIEECDHMKIKVAPPNINQSDHRFVAVDEVTINYGLGAIKGVGEAAIDVIVDARHKRGKFKDLFDFCERVDLKKVNRRVLETLVRCGAMDELGPNRATLMASLSKATQIAEQNSRNAATGQNDMFGFTQESVEANAQPQWLIADEWDDRRRLDGEKETLGLYLTGHPIEIYQEELSQIISNPIARLQPDKKNRVTIAGLLVATRYMKTKRGDTMAILTLDDKSGRIEVTVFADTLEKSRELIAVDKILIVNGEVTLDDFSGNLRMQAREVSDLDLVREQNARRIILAVNPEIANNGFVSHLADTLSAYKPGNCPVYISYDSGRAQGRIPLGEAWKIRPTEDLMRELNSLAGGKDNVRLVY